MVWLVSGLACLFVARLAGLVVAWRFAGLAGLVGFDLAMFIFYSTILFTYYCLNALFYSFILVHA